METYQNLVTQMEDMETMIEMGYEENDPALIPEIQEMLDEFQKDLTISVSRHFFPENMTVRMLSLS